jgi:hypothetical protein
MDSHAGVRLIVYHNPKGTFNPRASANSRRARLEHAELDETRIRQMKLFWPDKSLISKPNRSTSTLHTVLLVFILTSRVAFPSLDPAASGTESPASPDVFAQRTINFDLFSDQKAPQGSWARVVVPTTINAQGLAEMGIITEGLANYPKATNQSLGAKQVTRSYWGSSDQTAAGQPLTVTQTSDEQPPAADMPKETYAYWPAFDGQKMPKEPRAIGAYTLQTSYCGTTPFSIGPDQDFLPPIEMIDMPRNADLAKPIHLSWRNIPGALGYVVNAFAGKENETVEWTAGNDLKLARVVETRAYSPDAVAQLVKSGALLGPDTLSCTIPAGIFEGQNSVILEVHALGKDQIRQKKDVETRVIVRSKASMPIYINQNPAK